MRIALIIELITISSLIILDVLTSEAQTKVTTTDALIFAENARTMYFYFKNIWLNMIVSHNSPYCFICEHRQVIARLAQTLTVLVSAIN